MPPASSHSDSAFASLRPRLFSIAYRMLGTRADAEDVLQDAWLRWHRTDPATLDSAEAWLVTVVTRLAIDRLREAKAERESYVGWWLPEPLVEAVDERTPEAAAELASELSVALMWVLERLSPEERAAFLLRQVFDQDYADLATLLGKSEAACRQMVHRASERVQQEKPRFEVPREVHRSVLEKFTLAARSGEREALRALLHDEIRLVADGGGKAAAFQEQRQTGDFIAGLFAGMARQLAERMAYRVALINGEPGLLRYVDGQPESAYVFVTDGKRITSIYTVRNPDKLAHVPEL